MLRRRPARATPRSIRRIAGCSGSYSRDTRSSVRSTARQVLDQVVGADREEVRFGRQQVGGQRRRRHLDHHAGRHRAGPRCLAPAASRPLGPPLRARRAALRRSETNGNMIRSEPWRAARSSARSCAWKISSIARLRRIPRRPSGDRDAVDAGVLDRQLRLADVERADRHRRRRGALQQVAVGGVLRLFGQRGLSAAGQQELGAEQADAVRSPLVRALRIVGRLDVRLEPDLHAVGGDAGSRRNSSSDCSKATRRAPPRPDLRHRRLHPDRRSLRRSCRRPRRMDPGRDQRAGVAQTRPPPGSGSTGRGSRCDTSSCPRR